MTEWQTFEVAVEDRETFDAGARDRVAEMRAQSPLGMKWIAWLVLVEAPRLTWCKLRADQKTATIHVRTEPLTAAETAHLESILRQEVPPVFMFTLNAIPPTVAWLR